MTIITTTQEPRAMLIDGVSHIKHWRTRASNTGLALCKTWGELQANLGLSISMAHLPTTEDDRRYYAYSVFCQTPLQLDRGREDILILSGVYSQAVTEPLEHLCLTHVVPKVLADLIEYANESRAQWCATAGLKLTDEAARRQCDTMDAQLAGLQYALSGAELHALLVLSGAMAVASARNNRSPNYN